MSSNIQSSITGEDRTANNILTPLPSASSPSRSLEFDKTLQHFEGHGDPKGGERFFFELLFRVLLDNSLAPVNSAEYFYGTLEVVNESKSLR